MSSCIHVCIHTLLSSSQLQGLEDSNILLEHNDVWSCQTLNHNRPETGGVDGFPQPFSKSLLRKGGHRSKLASLRFCVNVATERRQHTQVEFVWITQRFRTIAVFPINWERLNAGVFTSMLPATKRKSRTCATRKTDVISERKHCSRKHRHTQVDFRTRRKCADKTQTIARKRWHGAEKRKRSNVMSTCGRLNVLVEYAVLVSQLLVEDSPP